MFLLYNDRPKFGFGRKKFSTTETGKKYYCIKLKKITRKLSENIMQVKVLSVKIYAI